MHPACAPCLTGPLTSYSLDSAASSLSLTSRRSIHVVDIWANPRGALCESSKRYAACDAAPANQVNGVTGRKWVGCLGGNFAVGWCDRARRDPAGRGRLVTWEPDVDPGQGRSGGGSRCRAGPDNWIATIAGPPASRCIRTRMESPASAELTRVDLILGEFTGVNHQRANGLGRVVAGYRRKGSTPL